MASGSTFSERRHALTGEMTAMRLLNGERWWGGRVADGYKMPFGTGSSIDLREHWAVGGIGARVDLTSIPTFRLLAP